MCGRFAFYSPHEAVTRLLGVADAPGIEPRCNIAPTQFVAAVREAGDSREVAMLYWGLVPSWAKEKSIGARMINDRMPVIVPPDAYAEWFDADNAATDRLARLLVPCETPGLQARPVSRHVNDARNQGPELVESLGGGDDAP